MRPSSVSVIVLAWGPEPMLEASVRSALASDHSDVDVIVVDNGAAPAALSAVAGLERVRIVGSGRNLGFAGGCNLGASRTSADFLVFLNSDARLASDAVSVLVRALDADATIGLAMGSVRLWDQPHLMNTCGNPWHFLGFVWAGGLNEPAVDHAANTDVASASGATMAVRRADWEALGGFDEEYFAYFEDAELSLRVWQRGRRVVYVADAASYHRYEFNRNPRKQFLLERNRLLTLLTHYEMRTLLVLAPALAASEVGLLAMAAHQRRLGQKIAAYRWLARNRRRIAERRRWIQAQRTIPDRQLARLFTAAFETAVVQGVPGIELVNRICALYWAAARRAL